MPLRPLLAASKRLPDIRKKPAIAPNQPFENVSGTREHNYEADDEDEALSTELRDRRRLSVTPSPIIRRQRNALIETPNVREEDEGPAIASNEPSDNVSGTSEHNHEADDEVEAFPASLPARCKPFVTSDPMILSQLAASYRSEDESEEPTTAPNEPSENLSGTSEHDYEAEDQALLAELRAKRKPFVPRRPMPRRELDAFLGIPSVSEDEESDTTPNEPSENVSETSEHNYEAEALRDEILANHKPSVTPNIVQARILDTLQGMSTIRDEDEDTDPYGSSGNVLGTNENELSHTEESNSGNDLNRTYIVHRGQNSPSAASSSSTNSFNISPDVLRAFDVTPPEVSDEPIAERNNSIAQGPLNRRSTSTNPVSVAPIAISQPSQLDDNAMHDEYNALSNVDMDIDEAEDYDDNADILLTGEPNYRGVVFNHPSLINIKRRERLNDEQILAFISAFIPHAVRRQSFNRIAVLDIHYVNLYKNNSALDISIFLRMYPIFPELILCPINVKGNHWTLLAINVAQRQAVYYDTLSHGYHSDTINDTEFAPCRIIVDKLMGAGICRPNTEIIKADRSTYNKQQGDYNCGVHVCMIAEEIAFQGGSTFHKPCDMTKERKRLIQILQDLYYLNVGKRVKQTLDVWPRPILKKTLANRYPASVPATQPSPPSSLISRINVPSPQSASFNIPEEFFRAFDITPPEVTDEPIAERNDSIAQGPLNRRSTSTNPVSVAPIAISQPSQLDDNAMHDEYNALSNVDMDIDEAEDYDDNADILLTGEPNYRGVVFNHPSLINIKRRERLNDEQILAFISAFIPHAVRRQSFNRIAVLDIHYVNLYKNNSALDISIFLRMYPIFPELILCPINVKGNHWTLLAINVAQRQAVYYDTLSHGYHSDTINDTEFAPCRIIVDKLMGAGICRPNTEIIKADQSTYNEQLDDYNCGVHVCMIAEEIAFQGGSTFHKPCDITRERERLVQILKALHSLNAGKRVQQTLDVWPRPILKKTLANRHPPSVPTTPPSPQNSLISHVNAPSLQLSTDPVKVAPIEPAQLDWTHVSSHTSDEDSEASDATEMSSYRDQLKVDIYGVTPNDGYADISQSDADNYNRGNGTDISQSPSNSPSPPARGIKKKNSRHAKLQPSRKSPSPPVRPARVSKKKNAQRAKPRSTATLDVTSDGNGTDARTKRNDNKNKDTYALDKPMLIQSGENEEANGLRRSKRTRVPPLRHYLGERPIYKSDSNGLPVLVGVSTVEVSKRNADKYLIVDQVLKKPKKTRK